MWNLTFITSWVYFSGWLKHHAEARQCAKNASSARNRYFAGEVSTQHPKLPKMNGMVDENADIPGRVHHRSDFSSPLTHGRSACPAKSAHYRPLGLPWLLRKNVRRLYQFGNIQWNEYVEKSKPVPKTLLRPNITPSASLRGWITSVTWTFFRVANWRNTSIACSWTSYLSNPATYI